MVNVATYNVYVAQAQDGELELVGDADSDNNNTITVIQPAAVVSVSVTVPGITFQDPPVTFDPDVTPPPGNGLKFGNVQPSQNFVGSPTILIHDVNTGSASYPITLNLTGPQPAITLTVTNA